MIIAETPNLSLRGLTKSFGGVRALDRVDFSVLPGEVHGLLGANGSGKSTLIKVLSGYHVPDAGALQLGGRDVALPIPPGQSELLGLAFVHQNLGLMPEATVLENLIIGSRHQKTPWRIAWRQEAKRARALFKQHNLKIEPGSLVADLSPVQRAQLAIVRAADRLSLENGAEAQGILVLDEPTPFLPEADVKELFALIRRLTEMGISIVFVSHDIDEVLEITDRVTVLRDGQVVDTFETATSSPEHLVNAIVGSKLKIERRANALSPAEPTCHVKGLSGRVVRDVSFEAHPGEILGLTGLIGSGYDEVPYLLSGAQKAQAGQVTLNGDAWEAAQLSPRGAMAKLIALIPGERQREGVAMDLTLTENATLPVLGGRLFLSHGGLDRITWEIMDAFAVKAEAPRQVMSELSGGNQQKMVLGKWFQLDPKLVLMDEPTQGIDVGARQDIYDQLQAVCGAGGTVICATSEFEQLEIIAHRVLVFDRGRIVASLEGPDVKKSAIAAACYRAERSDAA